VRAGEPFVLSIWMIIQMSAPHARANPCSGGSQHCDVYYADRHSECDPWAHFQLIGNVGDMGQQTLDLASLGPTSRSRGNFPPQWQEVFAPTQVCYPKRR
jgi:hypothetical protein